MLTVSISGCSSTDYPSLHSLCTTEPLRNAWNCDITDYARYVFFR